MKITENYKELVAGAFLTVVAGVVVHYLGRQVKHLHDEGKFDGMLRFLFLKTKKLMKEIFIGIPYNDIRGIPYGLNACYRASSLQVLFSIPDFKEQVIEGRKSLPKGSDERTASKALSKFIEVHENEDSTDVDLAKQEGVFGEAIVRIKPLKDDPMTIQDVMDFFTAISKIVGPDNEMRGFSWYVTPTVNSLENYLKGEEFKAELLDLLLSHGQEPADRMIIRVNTTSPFEGVRSQTPFDLHNGSPVKFEFLEEEYTYKPFGVINYNLQHLHYTACVKSYGNWFHVDGEIKDWREEWELPTTFKNAAFIFLEKESITPIETTRNV